MDSKRVFRAFKQFCYKKMKKSSWRFVKGREKESTTGKRDVGGNADGDESITRGENTDIRG